jgi:hypothetical protein
MNPAMRILGILVAAASLGCAAPTTTASAASAEVAWPPRSDQFGGFETSGLGIVIRCYVSADPHIYYFSVRRKGGAVELGAPEVFLAVTLEDRATPEGPSHLVLLGEFHSSDQLLFAMGETEATGEAAAAQFQRVLPPGAVPERISSKSERAVAHLANLIRDLKRE